MISLQHFPEADPKFSPEAIAAMSPAKRVRALAHIEKMKEIRDRESTKLRAINEAEDRGECYCDDEYNCGFHSRIYREVYPGQSVGYKEHERRMVALRVAQPGIRMAKPNQRAVG